MSTLANIILQYGSAYKQTFDGRLPPSHYRALADIAGCRTEAFGGHLYQCPDCDETHYQYHSCKNRHCPQCQYQSGQTWLEKQQALLLPVPYFMVTFTLPKGLRSIALSHQRLIYNLLFRTAAKALQELAYDPCFVGGQIGLIGVLHTWGRNLSYHPHVHFLVPAGGLTFDNSQWVASHKNFLVPVRALSLLFRAKFRDELQKQSSSLFEQISSETWRIDWVVHSKAVGDGSHALTYLAPYIFRVAISNNRILKVADGKVTFRYRQSDTGCIRFCTLKAEEFLRRFLQHVLPKGFVKVRYYGLFSPAKRYLLALLRLWVDLSVPTEDDIPTTTGMTEDIPTTRTVLCPQCGQVMQLLKILRPSSRSPP